MFLGLLKKDDKIINQLSYDFLEYIKILSSSVFCDNLQKALVRCSDNHKQVILNRSMLNAILGGCVIGGKGWLEMASSAQIRRMINSIELDVYEVDL